MTKSRERLEALEFVKRLDARFVSGNSVPIERTHITADEWFSLRQYAQKVDLASIRASLPQPAQASVVEGWIVEAVWDQISLKSDQPYRPIEVFRYQEYANLFVDLCRRKGAMTVEITPLVKAAAQPSEKSDAN
jgi:hypothetical protein